MPSQILITGATGFIGRRLTRDLVTQGANVRVLARTRAKARTLFGDQVEVEIGDLRHGASLERACAGIETVYHIAGSYRFGLRHRRELWETNVEGTEKLLAAAAHSQVEQVIHLSSGGVLEKAIPRDHCLVDEKDFPVRPPRFCSYKASKWQAEQRALAWASRGLPVMIASTTCPIGRGDEMPTPTGRMIRDFLQRRFPFFCRTGLNFIGVGDLSQGLQKVAAYGQSGERYLLSHENLWLEDFLRLLAQQTGLPAPTMCLPSPLVRLIGCGGELVDLVNPASQTARVCLETTLQAERLQFFSNAKAREELNWIPLTPLHESVREAISWFRNEAAPERSQTASVSVESHVR